MSQREMGHVSWVDSGWKAFALIGEPLGWPWWMQLWLSCTHYWRHAKKSSETSWENHELSQNGTKVEGECHSQVPLITASTFHTEGSSWTRIGFTIEEKGILKKVSHSSWVAPIVPVPKRDGKVRICWDYKVTVNPHFDVDQHSEPRPAWVVCNLGNGKASTKKDFSQAYQ